jgi:hypothetical protein
LYDSGNGKRKVWHFPRRNWLLFYEARGVAEEIPEAAYIIIIHIIRQLKIKSLFKLYSFGKPLFKGIVGYESK